MDAKIICAWCDKKVGETKTDTGEDSHRICIECYEKVMKDLTETKKFKPFLKKGVSRFGQ